MLLLKCRMQTDTSGFYSNIIKTSLHIYKHERFIGFYKGIFANTLINVPVSSLYEYIKSQIVCSWHSEGVGDF